MSKYTFTYVADQPGGVDVAVQFDDAEHPFIHDVLAAFEQFLLGVTFQKGSIDKYIDTAAVLDAQMADAKARQ